MLSAGHADTPSDETDLPDGLMFIGLVDSDWDVFLTRAGKWWQVSQIDNPSSAAYNSSKQLIAYIDSEGVAREYDLSNGETEIVYENENNRYTQPAYSQDGEWLYVVQLPKGKSRQTQIVGRHSESGIKHVFVRKRGAQFDPHSTDGQFLYYTTAACVDDCPSMIWELWRRNSLTSEQVQLTLTNAVARQPFVDNNNAIWFSSDSRVGEFRIWTMKNQVGAVPLMRTFCPGKDSNPVVDSNGEVFFLRHNAKGAALMQLQDNFRAVSIELPERITNLRNLSYSKEKAKP